MKQSNLKLLNQQMIMLLTCLQAFIKIIQQEIDFSNSVNSNDLKELLRICKNSRGIKLMVLKILTELKYYGKKSVDKRRKIIKSDLLSIIINILNLYTQDANRCKLKKLDTALIKEATEFLGIFVDDSATFRDKKIIERFIDVLISLVLDDRLPALFIHCTVFATIENFFLNIGEKATISIVNRALPCLCQLYRKHSSLSNDILQLLTEIAEYGDNYIQVLINHDAHLLTISILRNNDQYYKIKALDLLHKLTIGRLSHTKMLLKKGYLNNMTSLFNYNNNSMTCMSTLQCIANISSQSTDLQNESTNLSNLLQKVFENSTPEDRDVCHETAMILRDVIESVDIEYLRRMFNSHEIIQLIDLIGNDDASLAIYTFEATKSIPSIMSRLMNQ